MSKLIPTFRKTHTVPDVPVIRSIKAQEVHMLTGADGIKHPRIAVTLKPPALHVTHWEYQIKPSNTRTWQDIQTIKASAGTPIWITGVSVQSYDFQVRSRRDDGLVSQWATAQAVPVTGKTSLPDKVTRFRLHSQRSLLHWYYDNPAADFAGFELRYNLGNFDDWNNGTVLVPLTNQLHCSLDLVPVGQPVTVMICAVDYYGNKSAPTSCVVNLPLPFTGQSQAPSSFVPLDRTFDIQGVNDQVRLFVDMDKPYKLSVKEDDGLHPFLGHFLVADKATFVLEAASDATIRGIVVSHWKP